MQHKHLSNFVFVTIAKAHEFYPTLYNLLTTLDPKLFKHSEKILEKLLIAIRRHLLKNVSQEVGILLSRLS